MDIADLLFFVVFVIIIISNVYKQAKKARSKTAKGGPSAGKIGWKSGLELILAEARKQMEKQAGQGAAGPRTDRPTGWEAILSGLPAEGVLSEKTIEPENKQPETSTPEVAREPRPRRAEAPKIRPAVEAPFSKSERAGGVMMQGIGAPEVVPLVLETASPLKMPAGFSREALQHAVVWAEILAPPLGLRQAE